MKHTLLCFYIVNDIFFYIHFFKLYTNKIVQCMLAFTVAQWCFELDVGNVGRMISMAMNRKQAKLSIMCQISNGD